MILDTYFVTCSLDLSIVLSQKNSHAIHAQHIVILYGIQFT